MEPKLIVSRLLMAVSISFYVLCLFSTRVSVIQDTSFLAMLKLYPVTYWISISCILLALFFSKGKEQYVGISLLFIYLTGTPYIIESNIRIGSAYWPLGMAGQVTSRGSLLNTPSTSFYVNFPGYVFFASMFSQITSLPLDLSLKALTIAIDLALFWNVLALVRILLGESSERSRLLLSSIAMLFFTAGSWTYMLYFHPQAMTFLVFLSLLIVTCKNQSANPWFRRIVPVVFALGFFSILLGHLLVPLFIALFFVLFSFYSRIFRVSTKLIPSALLVVTIFVGWLMFQLYPFFQAQFKEELTVLSSLGTLFQSLSLGRGSGKPSIGYSIVTWTREGSILVIGTLALVGLLMLFRKKDGSKAGKRNTVLVVSYVSAAAALLVIPYGGEIFLRVFYFLLPILVFLVAIAFKGREKVAVVFFLFLLLVQPIAYVGDECTTLTTDNEFYGAFFVQQHFPTTIKYFGPQGLIFYFDTIGQPHFENSYGIGGQRFNQTYVVQLLTNSDWNYYCDSQVTRNFIAWYLGHDITDEVMNFSAFNRLYDSDGFTIFGKR